MNPKVLHPIRGVALIEALVALAVMAFGMLGVAAMQASLRQNADLARQRSEAVRLAQESIEAMRAYSVVNSVAGRSAYADLVAPVAAEDMVRANLNATYTRTVFIAQDPVQNRKTVDVTVAWTDRTNQPHQVRLSSIIHRVPPELSAALVIPGFGTAAGGARDPSIPPSAITNPDGVTSTYTPPQPPGPNPITWVFNNATGVITQRCVGSTCTGTIYARLLSGYVAFSLGTTQPTPAQAESPSSNALSVNVGIVNQTLPNLLAGTTTECFTETLPAAPPTPDLRVYYCLIQVLSTDGNLWSARSELTGLTWATSIGDTDSSKFRVCRYASYRNNNAVGSGTPAIANVDHPYNYAQVDRNLVDQNFLVIRAGDGPGGVGGIAFDCPADVVPTLPQLNLINTNTWHHQPAT